jgi:hypothetical protein
MALVAIKVTDGQSKIQGPARGAASNPGFLALEIEQIRMGHGMVFLQIPGPPGQVERQTMPRTNMTYELLVE